MKVYYSQVSKPSCMTVSQLNGYVKELLEDDPALAYCEVEGEISNFKHYLSNGHMYFTLKDDEGAISAVMYRSANSSLTFLPKDGMKVNVKGSVSIYSQTGKYQIYVREMKPEGEGDLYLAYEHLKKKLLAEGLFDEEHKLPLPRFPRKVGVITSKFGAALQDIISISGRRYPIADIHVFPSLVQGPGASEMLTNAVDYFDRTDSVDVIIVGRGGGSIEDLWAFNDERLARRIYDCRIPVISAVGHETDFTICDFVADMRAPTPSAAAEIVFPDKNELLSLLADTRYTLSERMEDRINELQSIISGFSPERISVHLKRRFDIAQDKVGELFDRIDLAVNSKLSSADMRLASCVALLESRSPLKILSKGYSVVTDCEGGSVRSAQQLAIGDNVGITFACGNAKAEIIEIADTN